VPLTPETLAGIDIFYLGFISDEDSSNLEENEISDLLDWVDEGGRLIASCDASAYVICDVLGVTTAITTPQTGLYRFVAPVDRQNPHPVFQGAFNASEDDPFVFVEVSPVINHPYFVEVGDATVIGVTATSVNGTGSPTILEYPIGNGVVILTTSALIFSDDFVAEGDVIGPEVDPTNGNDIFAGNLFDYLISYESSPTLILTSSDR